MTQFSICIRAAAALTALMISLSFVSCTEKSASPVRSHFPSETDSQLPLPSDVFIPETQHTNHELPSEPSSVPPDSPKNIRSDSVSSCEPSSDVSSGEELHRFCGILRSCRPPVLELKGSDGTVVRFPWRTDQIPAVGSRVLVSYTGRINPASRMQDVLIQKIGIQKSSASLPVRILSAMTEEEKIGQMFLARFPERNAAQEASAFSLGGYVLYARDFEHRTPQQAADMIAACQKHAAIPLLIAVDEEGGKVTRISRFPAYRPAPFPAPADLMAGGQNTVISDTAEKCRLLNSLGINVNLGPVCDVARSEKDYIFPRCWSTDPLQAAAAVKTIVSEMTRNRTGAVLKHFPGYGNNLDTHTGTARDSRPYSEFERIDFLPFRAGISQGAGAVMVAHNVVECMDKTLPASLSPEVLRILRHEFDFHGVIITDGLDMKGILGFSRSENPAVLAVLAGNDLLCTGDWRVQFPAVAEAVRLGKIPEKQIDQSVLRILIWKEQLGILSETVF